MVFRTMTKKSQFSSGNWLGTSVGKLLELKPDVIGWHYFKMSHMSFDDEILTELKIKGTEFEIKKPGVNKELYLKWLEINYPVIYSFNGEKIRKVRMGKVKLIESWVRNLSKSHLAHLNRTKH